MQIQYLCCRKNILFKKNIKTPIDQWAEAMNIKLM